VTSRLASLAPASLAIALAGCAARPAEHESEPQREPAVGTVFVLRPDVAEARDARDVPADESDAELVRRTGDVLLERLRRLPLGDSAALVPRGERLELALRERLPADTAAGIARVLTARGSLGIWIAAAPGDGIDLAAERDRLAAWLAQEPDAPLDRFHRLPPAEGGPDRRLRWCEQPAGDERFAGRPRIERCVPVLVPAEASRRFGTADLAGAYPSQDHGGRPAVGFELSSERKADFGAFTEANVDRLLAIEIDGVCVTLANINTRLPGAGIIMGRFTAEQVTQIVAQLRAGELPVPVELVAIR
jgi:hypothetical protein